MSGQDTGLILGTAAERLIEGDLAVGDTWEEVLDEGITTARFEVMAPVAAATLELLVPGEFPVLRIRWALEQAPVGPTVAMAPDAVDDAMREWDAAVSTQPDAGAAPPGWALPAWPSWDETQIYGPRTPLVLARASWLWSSNLEVWMTMLATCVDQELHGQWVTYAASSARAAARGAGRVDAVLRLESDVRGVLEGLGARWGVSVVDQLHSQFLEWPEGRGWEAQSWPEVLGILRDHVETCLLVEAVADLLPTHVVTLGQGAVRCSVERTECAPGELWLAPPEVTDAVARVLDSDSDEILDAAIAWVERAGPAFHEIRTLLVIGSSHAPCIEVVDDGTRDLSEPPPEGEVMIDAESQALMLQRWSNALATILAHSGDVSKPTVSRFLRVSRRVSGVAELVRSWDGRP